MYKTLKVSILVFDLKLLSVSLSEKLKKVLPVFIFPQQKTCTEIRHVDEHSPVIMDISKSPP